MEKGLWCQLRMRTAKHWRQKWYISLVFFLKTGFFGLTQTNLDKSTRSFLWNSHYRLLCVDLSANRWFTDGINASAPRRERRRSRFCNHWEGTRNFNNRSGILKSMLLLQMWNFNCNPMVLRFVCLLVSTAAKIERIWVERTATYIIICLYVCMWTIYVIFCVALLKYSS